MESTDKLRVDAILPAGGRIEGTFADEAGADIKALIRLDSETFLERTIRILRDSRRIGRIVVIGPDEVANHSSARDADMALPEAESGPENVYRGLEWLRACSGSHADRALIL